MPVLYRVRWDRLDSSISGEMRNVRKHELEATVERAWKSAGDGTVSFEKENHEVVEYDF